MHEGGKRGSKTGKVRCCEQRRYIINVTEEKCMRSQKYAVRKGRMYLTSDTNGRGKYCLLTSLYAKITTPDGKRLTWKVNGPADGERGEGDEEGKKRGRGKRRGRKGGRGREGEEGRESQ